MNISTNNAIQPHILMSQKAHAASHDIRASKSATQSAFSDYLFGPAATASGIHSGAVNASTAVARLKQSNDTRL